MLITILNALFLVAYLLSAVVQYNDPDGLLWIVIYLAAALMCIGALRRKLPKWYPWTLLVISLVWIGWLLPNILGKVSPGELVESISMRTREIEEAREIGGLVLVAIWAGVLSFRRGR